MVSEQNNNREALINVFGNYEDDKLVELVNEVLVSIGLFEAKDLKVGNPLSKPLELTCK